MRFKNPLEHFPASWKKKVCSIPSPSRKCMRVDFITWTGYFTNFIYIYISECQNFMCQMQRFWNVDKFKALSLFYFNRFISMEVVWLKFLYCACNKVTWKFSSFAWQNHVATSTLMLCLLWRLKKKKTHFIKIWKIIN